MIKVTINSKNYDFNQNTTIDNLLAQLNLEKSKIAVEINLSLIPRSKYNTTIVENNDKIEIVTFVGGG